MGDIILSDNLNSEVLVMELPSLKDDEEEFIEGQKLITSKEAGQEAAKHLKPNDPGIMIGGMKAPSNTNIALEGETRFGKTSVVKLGITEAIWRMKAGSGEKLIIYDATGQFLPFLYAQVGEQLPIYILNPTDTRAYGWSAYKDIKRAHGTLSLAEILVKKEEHEEAFFRLGAQAITAGVLDSFYLTGLEYKQKTGKPLEWTLADVANACSTPERMKAVLMRHKARLERKAKAFLDRNNDDVPATVIAKLESLFIVGAMWEGLPQFSLTDFLKGDEAGILVLGRSQAMKGIMQELNRFFIERAATILLDGAEVDRPRYWFFLDEFTELGRLDVMVDLLKRGIKYGIRTVLTYQDYHEIQKVYGDEIAKVIYSQEGTRYFFRLQGDNKNVAAERIGKKTFRRWVRSESLNFQGSVSKSFSRQEQYITEYAVKPEEMMNLEPGEFFCMTPSVKGVWKYRYEYEPMARIVETESKDPRHRAFIERTDPLLGYLDDWTEEQQKRFGLLPDDEPETPQKATAKVPVIEEKKETIAAQQKEQKQLEPQVTQAYEYKQEIKAPEVEPVGRTSIFLRPWEQQVFHLPAGNLEEQSPQHTNAKPEPERVTERQETKASPKQEEEKAASSPHVKATPSPTPKSEEEDWIAMVKRELSERQSRQRR